MLVTTYSHPRAHHYNGRFWMSGRLAISWRLIVDWPIHASNGWRRHKTETTVQHLHRTIEKTMLTQPVFTNSKAQSLTWLKSVFSPLHNDYSATPRHCLGRKRVKRTYDVQWITLINVTSCAQSGKFVWKTICKLTWHYTPACQCACQHKSYYQLIKALGHRRSTIHKCAIIAAEHESTD